MAGEVSWVGRLSKVFFNGPRTETRAMAVPNDMPGLGYGSGPSSILAARESRGGSFWLSSISIAFSLVTTALLLKPASPTVGSTPFGDFRGLFAFDNLSFAAIATNAANGEFAHLEPFTQTGVSYHPSFWYWLVGIASSYLEIGVPAVWTVFGSTVIALMVVIVGLIAISISGRAWTAALVGPTLWIGPLAMAFLQTWYLPLDTTAGLWGPYGLLFSLNAEAVGLSLAVVSVGVAVWVSVRQVSSRQRICIYGLSALLVGSLANIDAYAYLIATTLFIGWLSILGCMLMNPSARRLTIAFSLGIFVVGIVIAQLVSADNGSLLLLAVMAMTALPGIALIAKRHTRRVVILGVLYSAGALPQISHVVGGFLSGDPYLKYLQDEYELLTVPLLPFIIATAPIGAWIAALIILLRRIMAPAPLKALVWALAIAIPLLTFTGHWVFAQEPYRMWTGSVALSAIVLVLPTAFVTVRLLENGMRGAKSPKLVVVAVALIALSWWNVGGFRTNVDAVSAIQFGSSRLDALSQVATNLGGLVIADPCIDLQELKLVSGAPVAYYNPILAWPANRGAIDIALSERVLGVINIRSLRQARVEYVVTDSRCQTSYKPNLQTGYVLHRMLEYRTENNFGTFEVWRVT